MSTKITVADGEINDAVTNPSTDRLEPVEWDVTAETNDGVGVCSLSFYDSFTDGYQLWLTPDELEDFGKKLIAAAKAARRHAK